ncbi:MAG: SprB repeat-containing protein, partial [Chitinophagales bacterium]
MNYTIIFSIIAFLILNGGQVLAQVPGECNADPLPYHYGANWKNASAIPRLATPFTDYHTQHTDAALQGGNFVSTSTIVDHTGSGKLIKLHRFNPANGAVDELKYRYGGGTIPATAMSSFFGTTGNYITGGLENYTLGWHDNPALIKRFDFNAPPPNVPRNIDLLIRRHINNTAGNAIRYDGTVITKMIESGGDIFAVGYAYVTGGTLNNWTQAFMVRINPTVFNNPNFNCSGFGCTGDIEVRVIPHQNSNWISWFNDLIEFNGRIYACGYFGIGSPSAKIGWGLLSRWDDGECWSFEQNFTGGMPPRVPPPGSGIWPTISFNSMTIEPINNHLLLLYTDPFSYIGGILRMDNTNAIVPLALGGHTAFWLNNAPNPFVAPTAFPPENNEIILSQIEYVSPTSILIGGYMQDVSLPPGSLPTNLKNTHVIKDYFAFVVDHNPSITTNNGPFPFHSSYGYRNDQPLEDFETNLALKKGWDIVVPNGRIFSRDAGNDIYFSSGKRRVSVSPFQQSNFVDRFPLVDLQTYVVNPGGRLNCERRPMCLESADPTEPTMPFVTTSGPGFLQTELGIEVNTESRANIDFGEDFKHFCDQPIDENLVPQSSANPNVCAYFYDLQVDQNGTIYNTSNPLPGNRPDNMRLCQDDCIDLSVTFRHGIGLGENTYQWSRNGTAINGATDCNLQVCEADVPVGSLPVTYRVVCTHTESLGVCTAAYEVVIRAPFDDQILASPSNQLCQGQTATLSVNNTDISSYEWRRWNGATYTVVSNSATYATNVLGHYSVKVIYNNLCEDELEIDLTQRDITLTQAITETNSTNEDLVFTICNHNTSDIMNVELTTSLAPPLILDNNSASAGWINTGGNYTYTIPLLLAATSPTSPTCTPIVMPVRVNKCPATNMAWLSSTDPIYTCGTVTHSQPYWQGNNFTAQITNTNLTSCTGAPITLSGAPATGGFTYQWLRNSTPIPAATAASQTANTSGLYRVEISRNGCMKSDEKQVRISTPMTITHSSTQPVCTRNNGSITVNVTGGTAPYEYSINNGTNYTTSNVFNNLLAANYPIMVRDANGCTSSLNFNLTTRSNTLNYTATITPKICTAKGSIAIINPTTTGTCTAGSFTYLWSNGQTTATVTNLSPGSYTVTVTDCDGCTRVQTYQVGNISNTVNFTANLTHNTCASAGSIAIVNSSTTGSCGAGTYTYLWSNGQTTATATNLTGGTYTVKVTDCNGCTKVNSYTIINYNSLIQAEVVQSLMNCAITPNIVRYTAYPSGGTPGYNYSWLRNGTTPVGTNSPIYETNDQTNLSVIVTDANGYCFKKIIDASVNNPTVRNVGSENGAPNLSLTTIQTANNLRIRIKGNFNLDVNANWNHCDVIFETPTNSSTILTNVNLSSGIIFNAKNTHIHTCDANMQKGMVVQGTGRVDFDNCLVQDMYSAFQIIANADMRLRNNTTLENNFIGIKLLNQTVTSYNLNGGHQFNIRGG